MSTEIPARYISTQSDGSRRVHVMVDGMHCPSCVALIERAMQSFPQVTLARLNLSTKRLQLEWQGEAALAGEFIGKIEAMGYKATPFDVTKGESEEKREQSWLLRCLAVSGFASGNLMLISVPLWSTDIIEMGEATRGIFHWLQALIALPVIAYSGRPFFRSAWRAVSQRHTNMDVPISVAIILTACMSLFETIRGGEHAYFDSAVMLLFFLLIGRYLDARARGAARGAASDLLQMMQGFTTQLCDDGTQRRIAFADVTSGMRLSIAAGESFPADCEITQGVSDIDTSLITGESLPRTVSEGSMVYAGTTNIAAPLVVTVVKAGEASLLSEIVRLMEKAEQSQARYVSIADAMARWYTPVVHLLALFTFIGWEYVSPLAWQESLMIAATVLIITCPCALGLAVPVVQVLASGRLMRMGILVKSGSAYERLAKVTHVVFDKTGTLTRGQPELIASAQHCGNALQRAASLAAHSRHVLARALSERYAGELLPLTEVQEVAGCGMEGMYEGTRMRLGKRSWCGDENAVNEDAAMELWLAVDGLLPVRFAFRDSLRDDAVSCVAQLKAAGLACSIISGDREGAVKAVAQTLGVADYRAQATPLDKCAYLDELKASGAYVLMVGDGLNDAPALASASISMSLASGMDITQNAADIVLQSASLLPVMQSYRIAQRSQRLVKQNFALAMIYNVIAVPMAMLGYVTPIIAAIAMSGSSLVVIVNAMRLNRAKVS